MAFSSFAEDTGALSDAELLARSRKEPELFAILVRRHEAALLRRAERILWSREDAEEAVQDAFTKMYLYGDRYTAQEGASFSSWMYTILNRVSYTKYAKRRGEAAHRANLEPEHIETLPDHESAFLEELTIKDEVITALAALPETTTRLLRLQFFEGKRQDEIAAAEDLSVSAVKTRIHRAKKLFKQKYDEQHHG